MANISKREKLAKQSLYQIGYKYLCDNFHKFKTAQKIKVALEALHIFEADDSKSKITADMKVTVEITNENKTAPEAGNRISEYLEV